VPLPVVVVQGLCLGGGFELALRADVIFATESARFGHPEQSWGGVALYGGVCRVAEHAPDQGLPRPTMELQGR
jgi:enoyl-CoA hydratase/carnithine racemase